MRKFLIAVIALFIVNLGCKKIDADNGGGICACSPTVSPSLSLVFKNDKGEDLLNNKTTGFYAQAEIQLYYKEATGGIKQVAFSIRPPFSYGSDQFTFYQITSSEILSLMLNGKNVFYLKLKDQEAKEIKIQLEANTPRIEKLSVNNTEATAEKGKVASYINGNLFYITL